MGMRAGCGLKERCKNMVEQGTRWLKNYTFKQTIQARPSLTLQKSERRSPAEVAWNGDQADPTVPQTSVCAVLGLQIKQAVNYEY